MSDPEDPRNGPYYAPRAERFDVVLLKDGVAPHTAKPEDFRRLPVTADGGPYNARADAAVLKAEAEGYTIVQVVSPGHRPEAERDAIRRAHEAAMGPPLDRAKI